MKTRKILATLLIVATMLTFIPANLIYAENEVNEKIYATRGEIVQMLLLAADDYNPNVQKTDIIKGYGDGNLHEDEPVTRVQALVMLNRAFGGFPALSGNNLRIAIPKENFSDIPTWAKSELDSVFDAGIAAGTGDGKFSPDEPVTSEQMRTFINRAYVIYGSNLKDSFYASVNKTDLDTLNIPAGRTIAGTIYDIDDQTNIQIQELINDISESSPKQGSAQEKIKIFYDCFMDMDARNAAGYTPIADDLKSIENIKNISELSEVMLMDDTESALSLLADFTVTIDALDSSKYMTIFLPSSATQSKEVYEGKADKQKKAYLKYISTLLTLCGEDKENAEKDTLNFFNFEKLLSDASLTIAEQYDLEKTYNIYSLDELKQIFKTVDLGTVFSRTKLNDSSRILVMDKGNMTQLAEMLTDDNIDLIKNYLKIKLILNSANCFGEEFRNADIVYSNEAYGTEGSMTLEEEASSTIASVLCEYVGQAYAEKYCSDDIISDITDIIHDIIDVYKNRISALDWMSNSTKNKAILKLDTMRLCIGAPDYDSIESPLDMVVFKSTADGGSYYQNMLEISKAIRKYDAEVSCEPVDRDMWIASPQDVNAFYMPSFNSITIPIAFLQSPIYDKNASYEENMGGIGFVIGHEITHAFDSNGSQYDENGNAVNWWTESDKQEFDRLCTQVISFFDGVETAPGISVDGTLTLTENIADMGAAECITAIGMNKDNFDFKKMYESYAKLWLVTSPREALQVGAYTDVHSPANVRVDRVLQSIDKFYEVYGISENDGMYIIPDDRVSIW